MPLPPTYDEELSGLAEQVPGFGGLARDTLSRRVSVFLTDLASQERARLVLGEYFSRSDEPVELTFAQGQYDFRELARWRRLIDQARLRYVTMTDIDETKNRIMVGVSDVPAQSQFLNALDSLKVPRSAASTVVMLAARLTNLQAYHRPLVGGIQVKALPYPSPGYSGCSLGFVAIRKYPNGSINFYTPRYITTASHCTNVQYETNGDVIGQPEQSLTSVGIEYSDPPLVGSATDPACSQVNLVCRRSDAALFLLNTPSGFDNEFGGVATASGTTYTGLTYYSGKQQMWAVGMAVAKVGRTTGVTAGVITQSCVTVPLAPSAGWPNGREMVCQFFGSYAIGEGDSGGPVWHTSSNGQRWLTGLNWGRIQFGGTEVYNAIFSSWIDASTEMANDILARTGAQWMPIFTTGPAHY